MSEHLFVEKETDTHLAMRQKDFADAWRFSTSGGCTNFGQNDSKTTDSEGNGGDVEFWMHACDLDLLIEMMCEFRDKRNAKFPDLAKGPK